MSALGFGTGDDWSVDFVLAEERVEEIKDAGGWLECNAAKCAVFDSFSKFP
jgi:hypothetical protein